MSFLQKALIGAVFAGFAQLVFAANPMVEMKTNMGSVTMELFQDKAPKTVDNFLAYVKAGHYNGTIFHRVIPNFMIQGGGLTPDMREKPVRPPIKNEAENGLKNEIGTLAMARTSDINSATDQFFINVKNNPFLDHSDHDFGYAVFGKVVKGMDVVKAIEVVPADDRGQNENVPVKPVLIESIKLLPAAAAAKTVK